MDTRPAAKRIRAIYLFHFAVYHPIQSSCGSAQNEPILTTQIMMSSMRTANTQTHTWNKLFNLHKLVLERENRSSCGSFLFPISTEYASAYLQLLLFLFECYNRLL